MDSMHGKFLGDVQKKSCPDVSRKKTRDRTAEIVRIPYDKPVSGAGKGGNFFLGAWAMDQAIMRSWTLTFSRP